MVDRIYSVKGRADLYESANSVKPKDDLKQLLKIIRNCYKWNYGIIEKYFEVVTIGSSSTTDCE